MQYSLLSQFQGGFLGCAIGQLLAIDRHHPHRLILAEKSWCEGSLASLELSERLIRGRLQPEDWLGCRPRQGQVLAVLPIIFSDLDDPQQLRSRLQEAASAWQLSPESAANLFVWGDAISLALSETVVFGQLLESLLERSRQTQSPWVETIAQISQLVGEGAGLSQATAQLSRQRQNNFAAIAIALYCFATTPQDFRLCVSRALRSGGNSQLAAALAGAIAGAHNSLNGIPIAWRLQAIASEQTQPFLQQAERLFSLWSGVYQPHRQPAPCQAIAAAGTLQPRPSLKIVSQNSSAQTFP